MPESRFIHNRHGTRGHAVITEYLQSRSISVEPREIQMHSSQMGSLERGHIVEPVSRKISVRAVLARSRMHQRRIAPAFASPGR